MARERPTASDVTADPADLTLPLPPIGGPGRPDGLSHREAHALLRCAPLTSVEFKAQRQLRAVYGGPKHFDITAGLGVRAGAIRRLTRLGVGRSQGEAGRGQS